MMLMCGQSNQVWHYWAGKYPGKVGHLFGPRNMAKQALRKWMPFACDNDAYICYSNREPWDYQAWSNMLQRVRLTMLYPRWILVPDVVANKAATVQMWHTHKEEARRYGWPLAFAVQDGMEPKDVPIDADVVFVGGSTEWKWRTVSMWAGHFPRVHVGRVNEVRRLEQLESLGVESCDGTGWFRDTRRLDPLENWLNGFRHEHPELQLTDHSTPHPL